MSSLFLFAGEPSGDTHGGHLIEALKEILPTTSFFGVGGPKMRQAGLEPLLKTEDFSVMGFTDVLLSLPKLWKQFRQVRDKILEKRPEAVILIDYPGFNLRLARDLRNKGYKGKIIQYISPSVWAWGKKRIEQMSRTLDHLLVIYPFEPAYFSQTKLKVTYVGNPVKESLSSHLYDTAWKKRLHIPQEKPLLALFPGSRAHEIKRNLLPQLKAAELLKSQHPDLIVAISCATDAAREHILPLLYKSQLHLNSELFVIPSQYRYELMQESLAAIAKSGTVTLELALHACPTVVVYEMSRLNLWIAKYLIGIKLPFYCIVNIIAGRSIFPELFSSSISPLEIKELLAPIITAGEARDLVIQGCHEVGHLLSDSSCSKKAALLITAELVP